MGCVEYINFVVQMWKLNNKIAQMQIIIADFL